MQDLASQINSHIPQGWWLSHLIHLHDGCWQAHLRDEFHCVSATGEDIEEALARAEWKVFDETKWQIIVVIPKGTKAERKPDLASALGLRRKQQQPIERRF